MRRTIATMHVANISNLADMSDYRVMAMEGANRLTGEPAGNAECMVLAHPRRQRVWRFLTGLRGDHEGRFRRTLANGGTDWRHAPW